MTLRVCSVALVTALLLPIAAQAGDSQTMTQRGSQVMPFDMAATMHMFLPDSIGGVVEVVVHNMNDHQIALVRSHLLSEAAKFAKGDYSDPAYIHGQTMPGLNQLESGAAKVSVRYFETPTGAAVTFASADQSMVTAIHQWLAAQQHDHGSPDMQHCDMKM